MPQFKAVMAYREQHVQIALQNMVRKAWNLKMAMTSNPAGIKNNAVSMGRNPAPAPTMTPPTPAMANAGAVLPANPQSNGSGY